MKVLVVGVGSIGARHVRNIAGLGHEVHAFDINEENLRGVADLVKGTYTSLDAALRIKPDVAFICTYSNGHIAPALACARAGCHLFIEKPLSLDLNGVDELIAETAKRRLITMVGCNMRFHPALAHIHEVVQNDPDYDRPLWADFEFGYYLPFAKKNYRSNYMANRSMGGNILFDMIHEIDSAAWFFGDADEVFCEKKILSSDLKIDTGDAVDLIVKFRSGVRCAIHMDYLQHGYSRRCKVVSEQATIFWDFVLGKIGWIGTKKRDWSWKDLPLDIYYNEMYIDEIKYFFECIASGEQTFNSLARAKAVLNIALAAERSSQSKIWEKTSGG